MKRIWVVLLCLAMLGSSAGSAADKGDAKKPLIVKAWQKAGKPRDRETRILRHLEGFKKGESVKLDAYGGWISEKVEATGFFYSRKIGERWWIIDPEGYRFLNMAVNGVGPGESPQNKRAFPEKFGTVEKWRDATVKMLQETGYNGTACWSENEILAGGKKRLTYTPQWNFMSAYGSKRGGTWQVAGHRAYRGDCIFVFDPEFETFADEHAKQLAATKDDPYLIGHFSDNEMPFPRDSLDKYLKLDEKDPGRKAAEKWMIGRKGSVSAEITDADREVWRGFVADRYLDIVGRAIRKHDPNHMFFGPRFHASEKNSPTVMAAAGRHLDVIALNIYGVWTPSMEMVGQWEEWSDKPIIATEWYAKGQDSGMPNLTGAGWTVPTQRERGYFYQNFTLGLLESKNCVGWHWFKYMDNDPENLKTDPSNRDSNKGMMRTNYEPYAPLLEEMRELNLAAYRLTAYFDDTAKPKSASSVALPKPVKSGGKPLMETLNERHSTRDFSGKPLSPQTLSNLLWAAFGVNRAEDGKRTAPSAFNAQEVELYIATPDGLFLFDPEAHALTTILGEDVRGKVGSQSYVKQAPLSLFFVADLTKLTKARKAEDKAFYSAVDTGFVSQNVYLFCASEGLGTVVHAGVNKEALAKLAGLRPEQKITLSQAVGYPKE